VPGAEDGLRVSDQALTRAGAVNPSGRRRGGAGSPEAGSSKTSSSEPEAGAGRVNPLCADGTIRGFAT